MRKRISPFAGGVCSKWRFPIVAAAFTFPMRGVERGVLLLPLSSNQLLVLVKVSRQGLSGGHGGFFACDAQGQFTPLKTRP